MPRFKIMLPAILLLLSVSSAHAAVKVLSYSSLLDKGGLGEVISQAAQGQGYAVDFVTSKDFSGMIGTLRRLQREGKLATVDLVLGLNESNYSAALSEGLLQKGEVFEEAAFSILVNKENFPESQWPKNWAEVKEKLSGKLLIQDPRTSEVGLAWLLNATALGNLKLAEAKRLPKKVFPTWSASFAAFEANLAPAIWTYATSAAYYQCTGDAKAKNFVNLPLPAYPKDKNFVAFISPQPGPDAAKFYKLVRSEKIQNEIWQKNWMIPALYPEQIKKAPECFSKVWLPPDAKEIGTTPPKALLKQLDQWSL